MKKLNSLILALFFSTAAYGQPNSTKPFLISIIGTGQFSCGMYMEYKAKNDTQQMHLIAQWVWGFMSAYSARGNFGLKFKQPSEGNISTMPDEPTVLLFLAHHCEQHPLDTVMDGTFDLIKGMGGQINWKGYK